jgi:hypothetical protein
MSKSSPIFKRNGVHLIEKKTFEKTIIHSQNLSALNMQNYFVFMSSFEHIEFAINEKYSKIIMLIQIIMLPL